MVHLGLGSFFWDVRATLAYLIYLHYFEAIQGIFHRLLDKNDYRQTHKVDYMLFANAILLKLLIIEKLILKCLYYEFDFIERSLLGYIASRFRY